MLSISKTCTLKTITQEDLGYEYDNVDGTILLKDDMVFTITNASLDTFTIDTRTVTYATSSYLVVETSIDANFLLPIEIFVNNTKYTITPDILTTQSLSSEITASFLKIRGANNLVMFIQNNRDIMQAPITIKFKKEYLKLYGNHLNNLEGQLVGTTKIVDGTVNAYRQCYLVEGQNSAAFENKYKLNSKLTRTEDLNYYSYMLTGNSEYMPT